MYLCWGWCYEYGEERGPPKRDRGSYGVKNGMREEKRLSFIRASGGD